MNRTHTAALTLLLTLTACTPPTGPPTAPELPATLPAESPPQPGSHHHDGRADESHTVDRVPQESAQQHHGEAADEDVQRAVQASERAIQGWLTPDQDERRAILEPVASPALSKAFDSPHYRPLNAERTGPTHVIDRSGFHITTLTRLSTGQAIETDLILEPDAPHGWHAITIREH